MIMTCPACRSKSIQQKTLGSRTDVRLGICFCNNCGHGVQIKTDDYDIYSSGEFSEKARDHASTPTVEKIKSLDKKAFQRLKFYKKYISNITSALEVGSSIGSFVHLLRLSGIKTEGIEPDPDYAAFSNHQYGFSQEAVLFENYHTNKSFDLIYSFHVIEHIPDPEAYVKKAHSLLNEHGKILIECPSWDLHSFGDVKFTIWEPHLQYFTLSSMYTLLSKNGFKVKAINFIGSALYAFAEKADKDTFRITEFNQYHRRFQTTFLLNKSFPKFPFKIKGTKISSIILQYLLSKNTRSFKELVGFSIFSIKNYFYLRKEMQLKQAKACHVSYFSGWENAGDTVLSQCVRKTINTEINNGWDLIKITDPVSEKTIRKINNSSYLLIGGGGVLLPDSNPNSLSGWQWAIDPEFWEHINVPVIVYAIGYNFFKGQQNTDLFIKNLENLVKKADFFSLRNYGSIRKVKELLPSHLHHKICYQPCPTTIIRKLYPNLSAKKNTKLIGINVAYDRYERRFGKNIYLILDQIALAMKQLEQQGYEIINVCHLESDRKFEISLDHRNVNYKTINLQYKLPHEVYQFYNKIELMMGMRGHAQMIPFGLNTKIISLGSHEKLKYFLEDIDALDWYIDVNDNPTMLADQIVKKFNLMMSSQKEEIEFKLIEKLDYLFDTTMSNLRSIGQFVGQ